MMRQAARTCFALGCRPVATAACCLLLGLASCATTAAPPASKQTSPCGSAAAPEPAATARQEPGPIGTCKEPDREEAKGKANEQDDEILY